MIGLSVKYVDHTERVAKAARQATYRLVDKAAFKIRETAIGSIQPGEGPSPVGKPPHTHTQKRTKKGKVRKGRLPKAIVYQSSRGEAVIGPAFSLIGDVGGTHEHGSVRFGVDYPARSFMGPALDKNLNDLGSSFQGAIGS